MIKINNVTMPTPSGYTPSIMDITNAERNSKGTMFIELIATKWKLELEWSFLTQEQMTQLLNALESNVIFDVEFVDPKTGSMNTAKCYKGDRNAPMQDYMNGIPRWKNLKVNLIEV